MTGHAMSHETAVGERPGPDPTALRNEVYDALSWAMLCLGLATMAAALFGSAIFSAGPMGIAAAAPEAAPPSVLIWRLLALVATVVVVIKEFRLRDNRALAFKLNCAFLVLLVLVRETQALLNVLASFAPADLL
jgi:hypothetical protein